MIDSMNVGEEITAVIIGTLKLILILELADDRSVRKAADIGITI